MNYIIRNLFGIYFYDNLVIMITFILIVKFYTQIIVTCAFYLAHTKKLIFNFQRTVLFDFMTTFLLQIFLL